MSPSAFLTVQIVVVGASVGLAAFTLLWAARTEGRLRAWDLVRAGLRLVLVPAGAVFLLPGFGLTPFGAIRIAYETAVVATPLAALGVVLWAVSRRVSLTGPAWALAVAGLLPAAFGVWATFVEPYRLTLESATLAVPSSRTGRAPLRIGVLADLQCDAVGEHERRAVDLLLAQKPDLILVPGDICQATDAEWDAARDDLRKLLQRLDAPGGVWFVMGDVDRDRTLKLLRDTKVHHVLDEVAHVQVGDRAVTIGGVSAEDALIVGQLERTVGDDIRILLCHRPDHALHLSENSRIDLVVAGHTHGGQVVVPGFGPPLTLSRVPREVAAGGLHRLHGNAVYVSRGVGVERLQAPRMRFLCPPEVSILTVTSGPVDAANR